MNVENSKTFLFLFFVFCVGVPESETKAISSVTVVQEYLQVDGRIRSSSIIVHYYCIVELCRRIALNFRLKC